MAEESHDAQSETASTFVTATVSSQLTQDDSILGMSSLQSDASVQGSRKQPISTSPMRRKKSPKNISVSRRVMLSSSDETDASGDEMMAKMQRAFEKPQKPLNASLSNDEIMQRAAKKGRANFDSRQKKVNFENFNNHRKVKKNI